MSLVVRGTRVHAQYVAARTKLEATARVTRIEFVTAPVALPADPGSLVLASAVWFTSDWGAGYRVMSITIELGVRNPTLNTILRIARALGTKPSEFMRRAEEFTRVK